MSDMVEVTVKLPAELVSRWRARGFDDITAVVEAYLMRADVEDLIAAGQRPVPGDNEADVQGKVTAFFAAIDKLREGLTDDELEAIAEDMNAEYVEPPEKDPLAWLDEVPEDQR